MLLNNQWKSKKKIKKYLEKSENGNTTTQNLGTQQKLRGKFITTQAYIRKQEKSQIKNLTLHLRELEKE